MGAVIERPLVWVGRDAAQLFLLVERAGGRLALRGVGRRAVEPVDVQELVDAGLVEVERGSGDWIGQGGGPAVLVRTPHGERAVVGSRPGAGSRFDG